MLWASGEAASPSASDGPAAASGSSSVRQRGQLPSGMSASGLRHLLHGSQKAPGNDCACSAIAEASDSLDGQDGDVVLDGSFCKVAGGFEK